MLRDLHDLAEAVRVLEEETEAFWLEFARRPGGATGLDHGARWFTTGLNTPAYNGIMRARLPEGQEAVAIDALVARFRAARAPMRWTIFPSSKPDDLRARLPLRGFRFHEEQPGMAIEIDRARDAPAPMGARVERVEDERALEAWAGVLQRAFRFPESMRTSIRDAHAPLALGGHARRTYFVARVDGEPVATGMLREGAGVAGVYGIAVAPEARRRGLGEHMTRVVLDEGWRRGLRVGMLQASAEGQRVYERMGFRGLCRFSTWHLAPRAP